MNPAIAPSAGATAALCHSSMQDHAPSAQNAPERPQGPKEPILLKHWIVLEATRSGKSIDAVRAAYHRGAFAGRIFVVSRPNARTVFVVDADQDGILP